MTQLRFPQPSARIAKPRGAFYNVLALAAMLAVAIGCGGKPATPPPGAEDDTPAMDVKLGDESASPPQGNDTPTPNSPADDKPPADESGAK